MAATRKYLTFFISLLLFVSLFEARPLSISTENHYDSIDIEIEKILEDLYVEDLKAGGLNSGGKGHGSSNAFTLREIKKSGPSPGDGH